MVCAFAVLCLWWKVLGGMAQPPPRAGGGFLAEDSCSGICAGRSLRAKDLLHVMAEPQSMIS